MFGPSPYKCGWSFPAEENKGSRQNSINISRTGAGR